MGGCQFKQYPDETAKCYRDMESCTSMTSTESTCSLETNMDKCVKLQVVATTENCQLEVLFMAGGIKHFMFLTTQS